MEYNIMTMKNNNIDNKEYNIIIMIIIRNII